MEFDSLGLVSLIVILLCLVTIGVSNYFLEQKSKKTLDRINSLLAKENEKYEMRLIAGGINVPANDFAKAGRIRELETASAGPVRIPKMKALHLTVLP